MATGKCKNCELVNFPSDQRCRRCGAEMWELPARASSGRSPRQAAIESSYFYPIMIILVVGAIGAYLYSGVQRSFNNVTANDNRRVASQPSQTPEPLSRTEYDQKRAGVYGNAIQNSPGIAASQQRLAEQQKLMSPPSK